VSSSGFTNGALADADADADAGGALDADAIVDALADADGAAPFSTWWPQPASVDATDAISPATRATWRGGSRRTRAS
jgi:hypothetical protein